VSTVHRTVAVGILAAALSSAMALAVSGLVGGLPTLPGTHSAAASEGKGKGKGKGAVELATGNAGNLTKAA
jgi:hypothetical protein